MHFERTGEVDDEYVGIGIADKRDSNALAELAACLAWGNRSAYLFETD